MNRIIVDSNINLDIDNSIIFDNGINIVRDTDLELVINNQSININININKNINANIYILGNSDNITFDIDTNSTLNVYKVSNDNVNEKVLINLNGINSNINYILKTISKTNENYEFIIKHNANNSSSNIVNNGVNIKDGNLVFNVSSYIPNGIKGCYANQSNRIVNLTDNKCIINPNLYIDEEDVIANHSAYLGSFRDEEIFYLESRGIDYSNALNLLIKGFLINNIENDKLKEELNKQIETYWR